MKNSGTTKETKASGQGAGWEQAKAVSARIDRVMDLIGLWLFRLRKFIMAAPVVYSAMKLFSYNSRHLPEMVGIGLQSSGDFTLTVARSLAVMGPMALTLGCLVLMFFSRKAMYAWAISIFTLVLPILVLVSNVYPA